MPKANLSLGALVYLFSGRLFSNKQPKDWQSPTGEMVNGNFMFEEIFLTQTYDLIKKRWIKLNFNESLKPTDQKALLVNIDQFLDQPLTLFERLLMDPLIAGNQLTFVNWIKAIAFNLGKLNPALGMMEVIEEELDNAEFLKTSTKRTLLIFTRTEKVWQIDKISSLEKVKLKMLEKTLNKARLVPWWETARRQLKAGLTFARMRMRE